MSGPGFFTLAAQDSLGFFTPGQGGQEFLALVREGHNFFDAWSEEAKCFIHGRGPGFFIPGAPGQGGFSRPLVRGAFF